MINFANLSLKAVRIFAPAAGARQGARGPAGTGPDVLGRRFSPILVG